MSNIEKIKKVLQNNGLYISEETANRILIGNEYQVQAVDFLIETETTCNIEYIGLDKPNWGKSKVFTYNVTLKNKVHRYSFKFWDSITNTEKNKKATFDFYSVLACLGHYVPESFDEFCSNYGYEFNNESEYIKTKHVHLDCLDEQWNLRKLFSEKQLEKLQEIV